MLPTAFGMVPPRQLGWILLGFFASSYRHQSLLNAGIRRSSLPSFLRPLAVCSYDIPLIPTFFLLFRVDYVYTETEGSSESVRVVSILPAGIFVRGKGDLDGSL